MTRLGDVLGEGLERAEIAGGVVLPSIVEVHADGRDEIPAGVFVVLATLPENELHDPAAFVVDGLLPIDIVLPGTGQGIVVDHPVRILEPAQEGLAPFAVGTRG